MDVTSNYLIEVTGGVPNDFITLSGTASSPGTVTSTSRFYRGTCAGKGKLFMYDSAGNIEVYDNPSSPTLEATIVTGIPAPYAVRDIVYDEALDLVFFLYNNASYYTNLGTLAYTNSITYTVTLGVNTPVASSLVPYLINNPVTGEKYLINTGGDMLVYSAGASGLTLQATVNIADNISKIALTNISIDNSVVSDVVSTVINNLIADNNLLVVSLCKI